jgi:hypothetical protein
MAGSTEAVVRLGWIREDEESMDGGSRFTGGGGGGG